MLLPRPDVELFFRLHWTLMFVVNQRFPVLPNEPATPEELAALAPELRVRVREAFLEHTDVIDAFVTDNPFHLSADELAIVQSWRHLVAGKFFIFRELQTYTVFVSTDQQPVAYGVIALSQPFEELVGPYLPVLTRTVLLPFKDRIVYDGLLQTDRISFGAGIRRRLNESYKEAKQRHGIITTLPPPATPRAAPKTKARPRAQAPAKAESAEVLNIIVPMIESFCREHLNEEYAVVCRKMAEKLARKRPSPLLRGSLNAWVSGIVRAVGWANFLDDKTQSPHMRLIDIDAHFGVGESTGAARLKAIRTLLKMHRFEPEWTLPSRVEDNPLIWILEVNGLMTDVRHAPREVQEIAFRKGLIPYIPADRPVQAD